MIQATQASLRKYRDNTVINVQALLMLLMMIVGIFFFGIIIVVTAPFSLIKLAFNPDKMVCEEKNVRY